MFFCNSGSEKTKKQDKTKQKNPSCPLPFSTRYVSFSLQREAIVLQKAHRMPAGSAVLSAELQSRAFTGTWMHPFPH